MYVYFIVSKGFPKQVKIGKANDPYKRMAELQIGSPKKLDLLGSIKCKDEKTAYEAEKAAHAAFRCDWTRGEWFRCKPMTMCRILDYICAAPGGLVNGVL